MDVIIPGKSSFILRTERSPRKNQIGITISIIGAVVVYKILDLRTGEYFRNSDIYWQEFDALFNTKRLAEQAIKDLVRLRNDFYPGYEYPKVIPEYFAIIEVENNVKRF